MIYFTRFSDKMVIKKSFFEGVSNKILKNDLVAK